MNSQKQYAPDLTHVASRAMLAGGRLTNHARKSAGWLHEPNVIKPGLPYAESESAGPGSDALTAYLETLK